MKVIVCGGRNYDNVNEVYSFLDRFDHNEGKIELLVAGEARGADFCAKRWANSRNVEYKGYQADWKKHGRAAGPRRNAEMLNEEPDFVIAFPGGRGTENMVKQAKDAGVVVFRAPSEQPWDTIE